jgi:hypothetical protein
VTTYGELSSVAKRIAAAPPPLQWDRKVGIEIETEGDRQKIAQALRQAGLAARTNEGDTCECDCGDEDCSCCNGSCDCYGLDGACEYHCQNENCADYLVHPTADCTISGVECVIGGPDGTSVNSQRLHSTVEEAALLMEGARARVSRSCGAHVHVDRSDLDFTDHERLLDNTQIVRDELSLLMAAGYTSGIRRDCDHSLATKESYKYRYNMNEGNFKHRAFGARSYWLWFTEYQTVEFRGWNSTLRPWRLLMSLYVSAALVESARDGRMAVGPKVLDLVADYLPDYVRLSVKRQLAYMHGSRFRADAQPIPVLVAS